MPVVRFMMIASPSITWAAISDALMTKRLSADTMHHLLIETHGRKCRRGRLTGRRPLSARLGSPPEQFPPARDVERLSRLARERVHDVETFELSLDAAPEQGAGVGWPNPQPAVLLVGWRLHTESPDPDHDDGRQPPRVDEHPAGKFPPRLGEAVGGARARRRGG